MITQPTPCTTLSLSGDVLESDSVALRRLKRIQEVLQRVSAAEAERQARNFGETVREAAWVEQQRLWVEERHKERQQRIVSRRDGALGGADAVSWEGATWPGYGYHPIFEYPLQCPLDLPEEAWVARDSAVVAALEALEPRLEQLVAPAERAEEGAPAGRKREGRKRLEVMVDGSEEQRAGVRDLVGVADCASFRVLVVTVYQPKGPNGLAYLFSDEPYRHQPQHSGSGATGAWTGRLTAAYGAHPASEPAQGVVDCVPAHECGPAQGLGGEEVWRQVDAEAIVGGATGNLSEVGHNCATGGTGGTPSGLGVVDSSVPAAAPAAFDGERHMAPSADLALAGSHGTAHQDPNLHVAPQAMPRAPQALPQAADLGPALRTSEGDVREARQPLTTVCGLTFAPSSADVVVGGWAAYVLLVRGEFSAAADDETLFPNVMCHLASGRVAHNVRGPVDLAEFLAEAQIELVRSHAVHVVRCATLDQEQIRPVEWCLRMLQRRWGGETLTRMGVTKEYVMALGM